MKSAIVRYLSSNDKYGRDEYGTNAKKVVETSKKLEQGYKAVADMHSSFSDAIIAWAASYPSNTELFSLATHYTEVSLDWVKCQEEFVEYIARVRHEFEILSAYFDQKSDYQRNFDAASKEFARLDAKKNKADMIWARNNQDRIRKAEMMKNKRDSELKAYLDRREQHVKIKAKRVFTILGSGHMKLGREAYKLFGGLHRHLDNVYPFCVSEYTAAIHDPSLLPLTYDTKNSSEPTVSEPSTPCVSKSATETPQLQAKVLKKEIQKIQPAPKTKQGLSSKSQTKELGAEKVDDVSPAIERPNPNPVVIKIRENNEKVKPADDQLTGRHPKVKHDYSPKDTPITHKEISPSFQKDELSNGCQDIPPKVHQSNSSSGSTSKYYGKEKSAGSIRSEINTSETSIESKLRSNSTKSDEKLKELEAEKVDEVTPTIKPNPSPVIIKIRENKEKIKSANDQLTDRHPSDDISPKVKHDYPSNDTPITRKEISPSFQKDDPSNGCPSNSSSGSTSNVYSKEKSSGSIRSNTSEISSESRLSSNSTKSDVKLKSANSAIDSDAPDLTKSAEVKCSNAGISPSAEPINIEEENEPVAWASEGEQSDGSPFSDGQNDQFSNYARDFNPQPSPTYSSSSDVSAQEGTDVSPLSSKTTTIEPNEGSKEQDIDADQESSSKRKYK